MTVNIISPDALSLDNGKYTLIGMESGSLAALRHGEEWRSFVGDKFVLTLGQELREAHERLAEVTGGEPGGDLRAAVQSYLLATEDAVAADPIATQAREELLRLLG